MTPEAQRIAIAEACGWHSNGHCSFYHPKHGQRTCYRSDGNIASVLPDYETDLNAMHEAEGTLAEKDWKAYIGWHLRCTVAEAQDRSIKCSVYPGPDEVRGLVHATAAQRAEAFLRTLSLWKDVP